MVSQGRGTQRGSWILPLSPWEISKYPHVLSGLFALGLDFQGEGFWRESRCGRILTGNGEGVTGNEVIWYMTLMRPSLPPVSGLSFGIISGVFSVINILADALGPGVVGIHGDSPYYFLTSGKAHFQSCLHALSIPGPDLIYWPSLGDFFGSISQEARRRSGMYLIPISLPAAFLTAAIILLHTFWGVVFFDACERRRYWALGLVVGSHLLTSGLVSWR